MFSDLTVWLHNKHLRKAAAYSEPNLELENVWLKTELYLSQNKISKRLNAVQLRGKSDGRLKNYKGKAHQNEHIADFKEIAALWNTSTTNESTEYKYDTSYK